MADSHNDVTSSIPSQIAPDSVLVLVIADTYGDQINQVVVTRSRETVISELARHVDRNWDIQIDPDIPKPFDAAGRIDAYFALTEDDCDGHDYWDVREEKIHG